MCPTRVSKDPDYIIWHTKRAKYGPFESFNDWQDRVQSSQNADFDKELYINGSKMDAGMCLSRETQHIL